MKVASLFRSAARLKFNSIAIKSSYETGTFYVGARSFASTPAKTLSSKPFTSSPSFFTSSGRTMSSSIVPNAGSCSCGEAFQKISSGTHQYLDVRAPSEFEAGHAENAVNIPVFFMGPSGMSPNPDFVSQVEATFPKEADILVACAAGKRSAIAVDMLEQAGYSALVDVQGGFQAWISEGLPVKK